MDIKEHIEKKLKERTTHMLVLEYLEILYKNGNLKNRTIIELRVKIKNEITACELSVKDHQKLLKQ